MSDIIKCDKRQNGLFLFLKEGRDTRVAAILLKWKINQRWKSMNNKLIINTTLLGKKSECKTKACVAEKAIAVSNEVVGFILKSVTSSLLIMAVGCDLI